MKSPKRSISIDDNLASQTDVDVDGQISPAPPLYSGPNAAPLKRHLMFSVPVPTDLKLLAHMSSRTSPCPRSRSPVKDSWLAGMIQLNTLYNSKDGTEPVFRGIYLPKSWIGLSFYELLHAIAKARGRRALSSLKGVHSFKVYRCGNQLSGLPESVVGEKNNWRSSLFLFACRIWQIQHSQRNHDCTWFLHATFNEIIAGPVAPTEKPQDPDHALSLHVTFGWPSPSMHITSILKEY